MPMIEKICEYCKNAYWVYPYRAYTQKHCSRKCGNKNRIGKQVGPNIKTSESLKKAYAEGRHKKGHSKETIEKIRQASMGNTSHLGCHHSKETIIKIIKASNNRPTSYEKKIIKLIEKYNLPYKYVGDGKVIINYRNPDFINTNGQKKLIEVYCWYWHPKDYEEKRTSIFMRYGFKTLFINEDEIEDKNWEQICLDKIQRFELI